ncbi:MAG: hypothetical protein M3Y48_16225 [Actinomycetota bacterium]|nr:hypothetical protein [Actinomycetota bacterium]
MTAAAPERDYARAIADALGIERPQDSVSRVKDVVMAEIAAVDTHVRILSTQYFNHTYSPDFVLTWPREPTSERYVYLRFNDDLRYMYDGMSRMQGHGPIIFGLSAMPFDLEDRSVFDFSANSSQALVTDPVALGTLVHRRSDDPILGLLSAALVQGGRGLLDRDAAELTSTVVSSGFKGARTISIDTTKAATEIIEKSLNERQSGLLIRFLQAVWVGSGGGLERFPGKIDLFGDFSDDALEFLLSFDEIDDYEFWRSLGRQLTVDQIAHLRVPSVSPNLQHLIRANLDRLWCRACAVQQYQPTLGEHAEEISWILDRGLLGLRGNDFISYVSEHADDVRRARASRSLGRGITVDELRSRAQGIVLNSLRLSDGHDALVLDSESNKDVAQGERLTTLAEAFGPTARVHEAQATLESGQQLTVDFREHTAVGITGSKLPLSALMRTALPLLWELDESVKSKLRQTIEIPTAIGLFAPGLFSDQPTLFGTEDASREEADN